MSVVPWEGPGAPAVGIRGAYRRRAGAIRHTGALRQLRRPARARRLLDELTPLGSGASRDGDPLRRLVRQEQDTPLEESGSIKRDRHVDVVEILPVPPVDA